MAPGNVSFSASGLPPWGGAFLVAGFGLLVFGKAKQQAASLVKDAKKPHRMAMGS